MIVMINTINVLKTILSGQDPDVLFNQMVNNNPQFKRFVEENKDKTPEQIAREHGINPELLKRL